jgi:transposase
LLDALLDACRARKWRKARGRQRTDATHGLARVRAGNRLEGVGETLRAALHTLAVVAPEWVPEHCPADWGQRSGHRVDDDHVPTNKNERHVAAPLIGMDGHALLAALYASPTPPWLRHVPAVETLRRVWVQPLYLDAGQVRWRTEKEGLPPSGLFISSPYDVEARYAKKQTTSWVGYTVHGTETCDDEAPPLIPHVETTAGPVADGAITPRIHQARERTGMLPALHIVDTGSLDAELLVTSQREYGIDLLGPTRANDHWQAQAAQGFDARSFAIDWDQRQARGPWGPRSASWTPTVDKRKNEVVQMQFSITACQPWARRAQCPRAPRRMLTVRRQAHYQALHAARARATSAAYTAE